ncbi:MAG: glycosyltransferase [Clostridia bacterium]|nr:glycosyltransferase [Clostridia bacterium]
MFSIIVPVYNVETYVDTCFASLLIQQGDFEIIAVDDGSLDSSGAICDRYAAEYPDKVRVIHQKNRGLGGARNTGINAANGDWLLFVDSDDRLCRGAVEKLEAAIKKYSADIVIFDLKSVDVWGNTISVQPEELPAGKVFSLAEQKDCLLTKPSACVKAFRRELFDGIRFPEKKWFEDLATTPKLITRAKKIVYIDEVLYDYLIREGSITNNSEVSRNAEIMEAMDSLIAFFKENSLYDLYRDELEMLATDNIYVYAIARVMKTDPDSRLPAVFKKYVEDRFPHPEKNPYLSRLTKSRRLAFRLIRAGRLSVLKKIFALKNLGKARKPKEVY